MRSVTKLGFIATAVLLGASACNSQSDDHAPVIALQITPATAMLELEYDTTAEQAFTVMASLADGTTVNVSGSAELSIDDSRIGRFEDNVVTISNNAAGQTKITAMYEGVTAEATLAVRLRRTTIIAPAPAQAVSLFAAAIENPALAPTIRYPAHDVIVPPNMGEFDVHWSDNAGHDLFEVGIKGDYNDIRIYVTGAPSGASWLTMTAAQWSIIGNSERGRAVTVTVRSLASGAPQSVGSAAITTRITEEDMEGGIYYWASSSLARPAGIYRHDLSRAGNEAEQFYTTTEATGSRCVGCHVLSRDGSRMAITLDGGDGAATVIDVATRTPLLPTDGSYRWNFASLNADGSRMVAVFQGVLRLYDDASSTVLGTVDTGGYATHPDLSPSGDAIVYVKPVAVTSDWVFSGGAIVVHPFDVATSTSGSARVLVESEAGQTNYFPSWSPDGEWILFNRSASGSYDAPTAELYVVRADGSMPPIRLDSPNVTVGITNSWARWAPFEQQSGPSGEPIFWFTFSSKRDFGVRLVGAAQPQVWMAPFFPARAMASQDPSAPAFRLPAQTLDSNNHIAQWTGTIVSGN